MTTGIGAREPFQPAGPALAPPAAVLDQRGAAAMAAAAGVLVPLGQRARLPAQRQLLRRHDALHGQRAQIDDGPQLLDGARHVPRAVLRHGHGKMSVSRRRRRRGTAPRPRAGRTQSVPRPENQASLAVVRSALERITGLRSASRRKRAPGASCLDFTIFGVAPLRPQPIEHDGRTDSRHQMLLARRGRSAQCEEPRNAFSVQVPHKKRPG